MKKLLPLAIVIVLGAPVSAQWSNVPRSAMPRIPDGRPNLSAPAPRLPDGKPDLSGVWNPPLGYIRDMAKDLKEPVPFQPWAKALLEDRNRNQLEPHTRCKPSGFVRQFLTPYGVEFVELPEIQRIFIFDIGGPHTYREIYMDGRTHPANVSPSPATPS